MTVRGNIGYGLPMRSCAKQEQRKAMEEIAERFSIAPLLDSYLATLSGGEQQRTALMVTWLAPLGLEET